MEHITKEDFLRVLNADEMKHRNRVIYNRLYNKVIEEWETPGDWFNSDNKKILVEGRLSDHYWVVFSMLNSHKLPIEFVKDLRLNNSQIILQNTLLDYEKVLSAVEKMEKIFSKVYLKAIYAYVLRMCVYKGVNKFEEIKLEDISEAYELEVMTGDGIRAKLSSLLYYAEYTDKLYRDSNLYTHKKDQKMSIDDCWSKNMKDCIDEFIQDLYNNKISSHKMEVEKKSALNQFGKWYLRVKSLDEIENLLDLDRDTFLDYIKYIKEMDDITNKTKRAKLLALKQFVEWSRIKEKDIINKTLIIDNDDLKIFAQYKKENNLAFGKREYAEQILRYLIEDFNTENIGDIFKKEAIIIAANSGARISEIRNLEYNSCFYSEEEGLYKIILDYADKVNQENRPLYLTKDGYNAIKRLEELKREHDILKSAYNDRTKRSYIHLFQYRGIDAINKTSMEQFLERIKKEIGLIDKNGKVIKGGMHAFRHYFGMTVFVESDYNISVLRYLLGHRNYNMSYQYLEEEKDEVLNIIRNNDSHSKFSGPGLDTLVEALLNENKNNGLESILGNSYKLSDLINQKEIRKVSFGYCLKPCDNSQQCIRCKNFLLSKKDEDEIIQGTTELFELLCYKVSLFNSIEESLKNINIQKDIADLITLFEEIIKLEIDSSKLPEEIRRMVYINEE